MSRDAEITFKLLRGGGGEPPRLHIWMAWGGMDGAICTVLPEPANFTNAVDARSAIEQHYRDALRSNEFPSSALQRPLAILNWQAELDRLLLAQPQGLGLKMDASTCGLLPELQPIELPGRGGTWLDQLVPIVRRIGQNVLPRATDRWPHELAIIHQEGAAENFSAKAQQISRALRPQLSVQLFAGSQLASAEHRDKELERIFLQHRAVLFLGHLDTPTPQHKGGWRLNPQASLPVQNLVEFIASSCRGTHARPPELVVTGCCSGAWGAPGPDGAHTYFYPQAFLQCGVRQFVGAWMDAWTLDFTWEALTRLLTGFIKGWFVNPDAAAKALFDAKAACGNPVLGSLFQLYAADEEYSGAPLPGSGNAGVGAPPASNDEPTKSTATSSLQPIQDCFRTGAVAGDYRLDVELWRDDWSVAYAATTGDDTMHVVQVPNDAAQADSGLETALRAALRRLDEADLGKAGMWVAARVERLAIDGLRDRQALALVHDGAFSPGAKLLTHAPPQPDAADHFARVLEIGTEIAIRLYHLHAAGLCHGRLDANAVIVDESMTPRRVLLKDAWLAQAVPGRRLDARYADPDASQGADDRSRRAADCFALGVLLYEFATTEPHEEGRVSVRERVRAERAPLVPEALERVVRGCLAPVASVRPPALQIARRLGAALRYDGTYLSDLAENFRVHLEAGHRLFAVRVDDFDELLALLKAMRAPTARLPMRLFTAREGEGLRDVQQQRTLLPWLDQAQAQQAMQEATGLPAADLPPVDEAEVNATLLFDWIVTQKVPAATAEAATGAPAHPLRVVAIDGARWWHGANAPLTQHVRRVMTEVHMARGNTAIVIADRGLEVPAEAAHLFCVLDFPPPTHTELFERVLGHWSSVGQPTDDAAATEAALIAHRLYPCGNLELRECLAICQAKHGRIDRNVVTIRDDLRAMRIGTLGTLSHVPAHKLPPFDHFGWPPGQADRLRQWASAVEAGGEAPCDWLISGGIGCGKTAAARAIAALLNWPLFRLDALGCLRSGMGQSEAMLRLSLAMVSGLGTSVLLIDGLDRFVGVDAPAAPNNDATLVRMASALSLWMDRRPSSVVVVATAYEDRVPRLPAGWRRRFRREVALQPELPSVVGSEGLAYRCAVLAALFRRFRLPMLAADQALMRELAPRTCPDQRGEPLPSAMARLAPRGPLGNDNVLLRNGAEIEAWMAETLNLWVPKQPPGAAETPQFWRIAVA